MHAHMHHIMRVIVVVPVSVRDADTGQVVKAVLVMVSTKYSPV